MSSEYCRIVCRVMIERFLFHNWSSSINLGKFNTGKPNGESEKAQ